jgi:hypothetical protein
MPIKELHIICLNVPYPVDIGANYESFYKIVALHNANVTVHLHCFTYKNYTPQQELNKYCKSVQYYKRSKKIGLTLPYIVSSRINEDLYKNLLKDDLPILMDGLHTSYLMFDKRFENRKLYLRAHNVEHLYYQGLFKSGKLNFKNIYNKIESNRLKKYEKKVAVIGNIITLSLNDLSYFEQNFDAKNIWNVPIFFDGKSNIPTGLGDYCFYHGNLSVIENEEAVIWLLENVFNTLEVPFVIAGKNPSKKLIDLSHQYMHTCIAVNPTEEEMNDLISKAQINLLPSINSTGVKIKLINSLFNGRHCITNSNGANGFEDKSFFHIADDAKGIKDLINYYIKLPFTTEEASLRIEKLNTSYTLEANVQKLFKYLL